jgi:hypothetical protein
VLAQSGKTQFAAAQGSPQVALHPGQLVGPGGEMEGIDHDLGRLLRRQGRQERSPELPPALAGEKVGLQLGAQQRPRLAPEALDHVAEIDPPQPGFLSLAVMQARQGFDEPAAQEQIEPVMAQVHRELMADQPGRHAVGDLSHLDRAGAAHTHHQLLVVDKALHRQRPQV